MSDHIPGSDSGKKSEDGAAEGRSFIKSYFRLAKLLLPSFIFVLLFSCFFYTNVDEAAYRSFLEDWKFIHIGVTFLLILFAFAKFIAFVKGMIDYEAPSGSADFDITKAIPRSKLRVLLVSIFFLVYWKNVVYLLING